MNSNAEVPLHKARYTFTDIWNAAKFERNFNYTFWLHVALDIIVEQAIRTGGYCLICCAVGLISTIAFFGFFVVIPEVASPWSVWFIFNQLLGVIMLFCISFNYFMAVTTKAGKPTDDINRQITNGNINTNIRQCKKCNDIKPARTHHCSICKACVLKMDHHCPWLANCVGYANYRYFMCFLIWVTLTTSYVATLCVPRVFSGGSVLFPNDDFSLSYALKKMLMLDAMYNVFSTAVEQHATKEHAELIRYEGKDLPNADSLLELQLQDNNGADSQNTHSRKLLGGGGLDSVSNGPSNSGNQWQLSEYIDFGFNSVGQANSGNQWQLSEYIDFGFNSVGQAKSEHSRSLQTVMRGGHDHRHNVYHHHHIGRSRVNHTYAYMIMHWREELLPEPEWTLFFCFMLCCGISIGVGTLATFHLFLISRGQTTLEYFEGQMISSRLAKEGLGRVFVNPYDRGSFYRNLEQVFGAVPWYLMILPSLRAPHPYSYFLKNHTLEAKMESESRYAMECKSISSSSSSPYPAVSRDTRSCVDIASTTIRDREDMV